MGQCSESDLTAPSSRPYFCMAWWARQDHAREFCWKILKKSQQVMWKSRSFLKHFLQLKSHDNMYLFFLLSENINTSLPFPRLIFRFYAQVWCFTKWPHLPIGPLLSICSQESAGDFITLLAWPFWNGNTWKFPCSWRVWRPLWTVSGDYRQSHLPRT